MPSGILKLGSISNSSSDQRKAKFWEPINRDHVHFGLAVEAIQKGKQGFFEWCDFRRSLNYEDAQFSFGHLRYFGRLKDILDSYPNLPNIPTWFQEHLTSNWTESYVPRLHESCTRSYIGLEEAAKRIGCRSWGVAYLVDSGRLKGHLKPVDRFGRLGGLIEESSVERLLARRREAVDLYQAADFLQVDPATLQEMYYRGEVTAERGPITDGTSTLWFHLPSLWDSMDGDGESVSPDYSALPTCDAERVLGVHPDILPVLASHGLVRLTPEGIEGWADFKAGFLWEYQAARLLGLPLPAFRRWVAWGRVKPVLRIGATSLYSRRSLEPWTPLNRCTTKEAARILGLSHPQEVHRKYLRTGLLTPIGGPGIDGGPIIILRRSDVESLAVSLPRATTTLTRSDKPGELLTTEEAARLLGLSVGAFQRRYRSTDRLIPIRQVAGSRKNYFLRRDVEKALQERHTTLRIN